MFRLIHFNNASISTAKVAFGKKHYYAGIFTEADLTVVLEGNNTISITPDDSASTAYGVCSDSWDSLPELHFSGNGSLDISSKKTSTC